MLAFEAANAAELRDKVRESYVRVPDRTEGRTTEHSETWVTCRFLATLAETNLLDYPVCVKQGDRPDLVLRLPLEPTGVEIRQVIPEDHARMDAYAEREGIMVLRSVPHYRVGEPRRSQKEIEKIARGEAQVFPRMGHSVERDWVEAMLHAAECKAMKFTKPGFTKYRNNWLLLHDEWRPALEDEPFATSRFARKIFNQNWMNPFDKVFILRPRNIWEFSNTADPVKHTIPTIAVRGTTLASVTGLLLEGGPT